MRSFGPHQVTETIQSLGPFKAGRKAIVLWKFKDTATLLNYVGFLQKNAVSEKELERLVTSSLPVRNCKVASVWIARTNEDQLGFPIFRVTPEKWVMTLAVVDPTIDQASDPITAGQWDAKLCSYATYKVPLKRDHKASRVVTRAKAVEMTLGKL